MILSPPVESFFMIFCSNNMFGLYNGVEYISKNKYGSFFSLDYNNFCTFRISSGRILYRGNVLCYHSELRMFCVNIPGTIQVSIIESIYDKPFFARGTYAFIYESFDGNPNTLNRLLLEVDEFFKPTPDLVSNLSNYCNFPTKIEYLEEFQNETISKGIELSISVTIPNFRDIFFSAFRNLFEGLVKFKENRFVHGDISVQNIIYVEDSYKFIDFDFAFFFGETRNIAIHKRLTHTVPFFIGTILIRKNNEDELETYRYEEDEITGSSLYFRRRYLNFPNTVSFFESHIDINNLQILTNIGKKIEENNSMDDIYSYISMYQLCKTFIFFCLSMNLQSEDFLSKFIKEVLSLDNYKLKTVENCLDVYDSIFLKK